MLKFARQLIAAEESFEFVRVRMWAGVPHGMSHSSVSCSNRLEKVIGAGWGADRGARIAGRTVSFAAKIETNKRTNVVRPRLAA